ncbi:MAG: DegV family protein [Asgard group archaeon]|nr:DegV family protein [Asgard group archaeon]
MDSITDVGIITDSASDITWKYADLNGIKIVPLTIIEKNQTFKEDRDYDFTKHYNKYSTNKDFSPKTSQPSPQEFFEAFEELIKQGKKEIIVISISAALSGTMNSAKAASNQIAQTYNDVSIYLIDSKNASYAEGFLIEEAIYLINTGLSAKEIVSKLENLVKNIYSFLLIPSLKYLYRGGRVSLTKYLLARLLRKMVIIRTAEDGSLQPVGAIGNIKEGLEKITNLATDDGKRFPRKVAIVYAINEDLKNQAIAYVKEYLPTKEDIRIIQTRAAITAHVGPSAIAVVAEFGE